LKKGEKREKGKKGEKFPILDGKRESSKGNQQRGGRRYLNLHNLHGNLHHSIINITILFFIISTLLSVREIIIIIWKL